MKRLIASLTLAALLLAAAAGCQSRRRTITVGATVVPHAQILAVAAELLKKDGILRVIEFNDYVQPNLQLADKQLDATFFQHIPYLEDFNAEHKLDLTYIAKVHVEPFGVYSQTIHGVSHGNPADLIIPLLPWQNHRRFLPDIFIDA